MVWTARKFFRGQRFVAGVSLFALVILYFGGLVAFQSFMNGSSPQVLGARSFVQGGDDVSRAPLAYAPDFTPPPVENGAAPVLFRVPTDKPVVFLTIDDGFYREPAAAEALTQAKTPATLFLVEQYVNETPYYFGNLSKSTGSSIENHTVDHRELIQLGYEDQRKEICGAADAFEKRYGRRPAMLRPPYGSFDENTKRASAACGMRAVVHWKALVEDGVMRYQNTDKLHPGDIVLMHFTPNFLKDAAAFERASKEAGLTPQPLDAWLAH